MRKMGGMIKAKETDTFAENLAAIAAGDENATIDLTLEIVPGLLRFAEIRGARNPETLVQGILVDAMRNMGHFNGTRSDLLAVLRRVIGRYIAAESDPPEQEDLPGSPLAATKPLHPRTDIKLEAALLNGVETVKAIGLVIPKPRVNPKSASVIASAQNPPSPATTPYRPDIGLRSTSLAVAAPTSQAKQSEPPQPQGADANRARQTNPSASTSDSDPTKATETAAQTSDPVNTHGYRESLSWSRRLLLLAGLTVLIAPVALIF